MTTAELELDVDAAYTAVDKKRRQLRMHRVDVTRELGLAPAAFTRLDHGRIPSATTMIRIMAWLDRDVSDFTRQQDKGSE
jgi:hypothetical protein